MAARYLFRMVSVALLASSSVAAVQAADVTLLGPLNTLVTVDSASPGTVLRTVTVTGVDPSQGLVGLDARPASRRVLYGYNQAGQLYAINPFTGTAAAIGMPNPSSSTAFAFDFNPSVDRIRLIANNGTNLRLHPDTGAIAGTDAPVAYASGDPGFGAAPSVVGAAYTNNVPGGTPTTLYVIESARGVLATQGSVNSTPVSPNSGQLYTVGSLGVATNSAVGFDISSTGEVLASLTNPQTNVTSLYRVNLSTGAATLVGTVAGNTTFRGLAFSATPLAVLASTDNQRAIGTRLDRFTGVPSADLLQLLAGIDSLSAADTGAALDQLGPGSFSILPEVAFQTANFIDAHLRRYMRDVRAGEASGNVATTDGGADQQMGFWIAANTRDGNLDNRSLGSQVDYRSTGVLGGIDFRSGGMLVGAMAGYDGADARLSAIFPKSDVKTYFGGFYGSFKAGLLNVDAHGTYAKSNYDLRRRIQIGGFNAANMADTESKQWMLGATTSSVFDAGGLEVEPYGGVRYVNMTLDGFTEGAGLTALTVEDEDDIVSVQSILGVRVGASLEMLGATVQPSIRGEWRHEFEDGDRMLTATFGGATIGGTPFQFATASRNKDFAMVGAGFTVSRGGSLSFVLDYNGQLGGDADVHGITGGLRLTF